MISRVADQCFWLGRYLDRCESTARLLQATRSLVFDADIPVTHCWQPLVIVSGEQATFVQRHGPAALGRGEVVQEYMTWCRENMVSLASSARCARECARAVSEQLSLDVWEEINELYLWLGRESTEKLYRDDRDDFYRRVRRSTQLTMGLVRSTMLHEEPMTFLWLGAMLERAGQTARILDMHHHTMAHEAAAQTHDIVQVALWMSLLRACSGSEAFMKKIGGRITAHSAVSFLLFERGFPRSLRYCLRSALDLLRKLGADGPQGNALRPSSVRLTKLLGWLESQERAFDVRQIHAFLTHVVDETSSVCSAVGQEILGPLPPPAPSQASGAAKGLSCSESQTQLAE